MATIMERAIDTERGDAIAANALAMGEVPELRAFIVKIRRGRETRVIFEAFGFDSFSVTAQHADLCEAGEYIVVTPRCRCFSEEDLQAADLARNVNKGQKLAARNDADALDLQTAHLDAMRRAGAL